MGENCNVQLLGNRIKGKELAKGSVVENMPMKCLADISNLPKSSHGMKLQGYSPNTKEYIHELHQEIVSLMKLLADKTTIIQLLEVEIQKLSTICKQVQLKNQQFAQANSQMLGELNSAKDKLKVLQHELGCKNGLLVARNLESEAEPVNCNEVRKSSRADNKNNGPCNKKRMRQSKSLDNNSVNPVKVQEQIDNRRRRSSRFNNVEQVPNENRRQSRRRSTRFKVEEEPAANAESSDTLFLTTGKPGEAEMKTDDNRHCFRRQSARFSQQEQLQEATRDLSQVDDVEVHASPLYECGSTSSARIKFETPECVPGSKDAELRASRPKRQATEKVESYKEIPLNIKMRRYKL